MIKSWAWMQTWLFLTLTPMLSMMGEKQLGYFVGVLRTRLSYNYIVHQNIVKIHIITSYRPDSVLKSENHHEIKQKKWERSEDWEGRRRLRRQAWEERETKGSSTFVALYLLEHEVADVWSHKTFTYMLADI